MSKCTEIVFKKGKMVKRDGLEVLQEKMRTLHLDQFLAVDQADGVKTKKVYKRVNGEVKRQSFDKIRT